MPVIFEGERIFMHTVGIGKQNYESLIMSDCFYVDKTYFIKQWWESQDDVTLITRPRRFGKSMAANMLVAYYSKGCDSKELFENFKIADDSSFKEHLNKYNVFKINVQEFFLPFDPCHYLENLQIIKLSADLFSHLLYG